LKRFRHQYNSLIQLLPPLTLLDVEDKQDDDDDDDDDDDV